MRRAVWGSLLLGAAVLAGGCADFLDPKLPTPRERAQEEMKTLRESRNPRERAEAARSLGRLGAPEAVPVLIDALRDPDARVRGQAAEALGEIKGAAAESIPPLREAVGREPVVPARVDMAWALKQLKADPREWMPAMRSGLGDPDPHTRYNAAIGLIGRGDPVEIFPVVFNELGTAFGDKTDVRPAGLIGDIVKSNDARLVPLLVAGLQRGNNQQRAVAAINMISFKPLPVAQIRGPLIEALKDPEPDVRQYAAIGLMRIGYEPGQGAQVGPPLIELLRDSDPKVRKQAAGAFRSMKQAPRNAIPALAALLHDPDPEVRAEGAFALMGFIPPAREAVPALTGAFPGETQKQVRVNILRALGSIGAEARPAVPMLRQALRDPDAGIRDAAAEALSLIERR
jgi:HEAT repeat protein